MALQNDRFLRALKRQPVDRTPVWMMRQAGRYLPEYKATRKQAGSFMDLCRNAELACEVTMQPLRRFPLDAAILFSDILTIPDAMGLGLYFVEGEGPKFKNPVRDVAAINKLGKPDAETELGYVMNAVRTIRAELGDRLPLIGFAGSPWTLATYMVEGQASREFATIKALIHDEPAAAEQLLNLLADSVADYLLAQIAAGADVVQIFDTWGGALAWRDFERCSLAPMQRIVSTLKAAQPDVPVILFTKNGGQYLEKMAATGADALGLDWTSSLGDARRRVGNKVALQGNLDPSILFSRPERIQAAVSDVLEDFGLGSGHVFNLGHGISQHTDPEHAAAMIAAVQAQSPAYHRAP